VQSQYCGTAPYSLRSTQAPAMHAQHAPSTSRAHDATTILHIFAGQTRTAAHMPTSAALPNTVTPRTRAHRYTHDATRPTQHTGTSASRRVSPKTTHTYKPRTHIAHSHATYKHTSPARPHDVPHNPNHCALPEHHCTHTAARTPHTARHTAPTTPHTAHRKSHPVTHAASAPHSRQISQAAQRPWDAAGELVVVQLQPPAGHTNSHRVTPWHPTPPPTPASRPQRIASHRIASIKSSQMKASQHTACYRSRTTPCASDPNNDTTRQPTGS
jgi:hypothetical protein